MDLTRYIFKTVNKFEVVLGKISDISNQYLVLEYESKDVKSASGISYTAIDLKSPDLFFDTKYVGIFIRNVDYLLNLRVFSDEEIGSIVRYDYDKYLWIGVWLNTYAQLNIPSPIFFNTENIMNDIRMMYFGKQSEEEILKSIRDNFYNKKYQNDLKTPLIDISKKYTDEFSIVEEPRNADNLKNFIDQTKKEKRESDLPETTTDFRILKPIGQIYPDVNDIFQKGYLYLIQPNNVSNFLIENDVTTGGFYTFIYCPEDYQRSNYAINFFPSLLLKKDVNNYDSYLTKLESYPIYDIAGHYLFAPKDFLNEQIQLSTNEKYELGTIINFKVNYIVIGVYTDENNILKYISINESVFLVKKELTNNALRKKIKTWSESEIDDLAKKQKVKIFQAKESSYTPKEYLYSDIKIINPFQQQTMAKLSDELDTIRNKNARLYDAFLNVINVINRKIEDKIPVAKSTPKTDLFGIGLKPVGGNAEINFQDDIKNGLIAPGTILDEFMLKFFESFDDQNVYKFFTNTEDLIQYCGKLLQIFIEAEILRKVRINAGRTSYFITQFYNLPLFNQNFQIKITNITNEIKFEVQLRWGGRSGIVLVIKDNYYLQNMHSYDSSRQLSFYVNIIRQILSQSYIQRLRYEQFIDFGIYDSLKESLKMLNPYFYFDKELFESIGGLQNLYILPEIYNFALNDISTEVRWVGKQKFQNYGEAKEYGGNIESQTFIIFPQREYDHIKELRELFEKFDKTTLDVFDGLPLPKVEKQTETDDFLSELDTIDFSDPSLFVDSIIDEVNDLDFDDPSLFN